MGRDRRRGRDLTAEDLPALEQLATGVAAYFVAAHRFDLSGTPEDFAWVVRLETRLFETVKVILRVDDLDRPSHVAEWSRCLPGGDR